MHPEDRRAARLARIRAERGSMERQGAIERLEAERAAAKKPKRSAPSGRKTPDNSDSYFGYSWPEWGRLVEAGRDFVVECARQGTTTTYGKVWEEATTRTGIEERNRYRATPNFMGYVATFDLEETGLLLTALVVEEGADKGPGPGFFRLAVNEGLLPKGDYPEEGTDWVMTPEQRVFWEDQIRRLFERYGEEP